ncbi:aldehyde dehydrogenase family protein, partial [bacterium BMS3Abin03]|nr:aldehyde dehydrogenase family protein [bacterium BMS3Abin03]
MMQSINPYNEKVIRSYAEHSRSEVEKIINSADSAFKQWRCVSFEERSSLMKKAAEVLKKRKGEFGELMTLEMGKPIQQSIAEVEKCAWVCEYYSEYAEQFLTDELIKTDATKSYVSYQPLGVVLAVMPWNFPFWQVFRFAAPGLMAGNA